MFSPPCTCLWAYRIRSEDSLSLIISSIWLFSVAIASPWCWSWSSQWCRYSYIGSTLHFISFIIIAHDQSRQHTVTSPSALASQQVWPYTKLLCSGLLEKSVGREIRSSSCRRDNKQTTSGEGGPGGRYSRQCCHSSCSHVSLQQFVPHLVSR